MLKLSTHKEIWKDVPGYEEYFQVSNFGRVRGLDRFVNCMWGKGKFVKGGIKKLSIDKYGYLRTTLSFNNFYKNYGVHRIVALAFIPNPKKKPQVNHKDFNRKNNKVENLEWATNKENSEHAQKAGRFNGINKGETNKNSKLTKNCVIAVREAYSTGLFSMQSLAKYFEVSQTCIMKVIHNKTWKNI